MPKKIVILNGSQRDGMGKIYPAMRECREWRAEK